MTVMEGRLKFLENQVQQQPVSAGMSPLMLSHRHALASAVSRQHLLDQYSSSSHISTSNSAADVTADRAYSSNPWSPDIKLHADDPDVFPHGDKAISAGKQGCRQLNKVSYQGGACLSSPLRSLPTAETAASVGCSQSTCGTAASIAMKKLASRTKEAQALLSSLNSNA